MAKNSVRNFSSVSNAYSTIEDAILEDECLKDIGVKYDDKDLSIDWKISAKDIILSKVDIELKLFKDVISPFDYGKNYYLMKQFV